MEAHAAAARPAPAGRPWVLLNMVASTDGATALAGRSGGLGGPADHATFRAVRAVADVIVAGASTVRAESYGPPRTSAELQAMRIARGQAPFPRLAVVTRSLDLDPTSEMFTAAPEPPLVLTGRGAPAERHAALGHVAEVHEVGDDGVDLAAALALLGDLGARTVLCEGGPALNGQLLAADLVDELNLTIAPVLAAGRSARAAHGAIEVARPLALAHLWEHEGELLARYVRR